VTAAENHLKDLLFKNIDLETFNKNLDLGLNDGGAGWNKLRAESFSKRIDEVIRHAEALAADYNKELEPLADYLINLFKIKMTPQIRLRFISFLKMRVENRIDVFGLQERLDTPVYLGGVGMYKSTAEIMVKEMEIMMLLKYSA
jgi:hypothetical protein